ncbi:NYN domain-containing protein [Salinadaptatus halalkaliphilus]|uniref:NYN domain-containing protein n=1 Tax=Salinadaptatus halalkaliphilus TaxID=2419781 RepID=A0A4S3TJC6_9EURY|nr:NYN domain-containing protein [Salinadaptatus halalkaliphilus]THE63333.1 NYN domain-containing protein [Salinadaptatus halalkaliphilus]
MFDTVRARLSPRDTGDSATPTVGLFVDGPNVFREEFDVDMNDLRTVATDLGRVGVLRLYLDEHATPGLIQAAEARGFEVVITSGDVDVKLAVDATALASEGTFDRLAIASRDTDFKPVLEYAGKRGLETTAIAPGSYGRSDALQNAADDAITLENDTQ